MPRKNQILTASNIRYLLMIRELSGKQADIQSVDIANALGITKPSVHTMLKILSDMKLVIKAKYGTVSLTAEGQKTAELYSEYFSIVQSCLTSELKLTQKQSANVTCHLLAELPIDEIATMCKQISKSKLEGNRTNVS